MTLAFESTNEAGVEAEPSQSATTATTFVVVVAALLALALWIGPRVPWELLGLCVGAWAVNVAVWRPSKWIGGITLLAVVIADLVVLDLSQLPLAARLIAVGVILICLLPSALAPLRNRTHFPAVHLFGLMAAVYTAVGALVSHDPHILSQLVSPTDRQRGLVLYGVFMAAVVAGATLAGGRLLRRPREELSPAADPEAEMVEPPGTQRALVLIVGGFVATLATRKLGIEGRLGLLVDVIQSVRLIGFLILLRLWLEGERLALWTRVALVGALCLEVAIGLGSGFLFQAARTPFAVAIMYVHVRRRIPWAALLLATVALLTLNVQKDQFRQEAGGIARLSQGNLLDQGLSYASTYVGTAPHITQEQLSKSASRFAYSTSDLLGYLDRRVPKELPYWDARTYKYIPFAAIPRVLFPSKPTTLSGQEFGHDYDLLDPSSTDTSANLPLAAEAFVNFGRTGLVLVGGAFGFLLGLLGRLLRRNTWAVALTGTIVAAQLISGIEADSSVVLGIAVWLGVFAYPIARWAVATRAPLEPSTS